MRKFRIIKNAVECSKFFGYNRIIENFESNDYEEAKNKFFDYMSYYLNDFTITQDNKIFDLNLNELLERGSRNMDDGTYFYQLQELVFNEIENKEIYE